MSGANKRLHIGLFAYILVVIVIGAVLLPVFGGKNYLYAIGSFGMGFVTAEEEQEHSHGHILFVGDIMLARDVERTLDVKGAGHPYRHMTDVFAAHRYQIANFEASIPNVHQPTPDFGYTFSVKEKYAAELIGHGFTHLSLANNHSFDFGSEGFASTNNALTSLGAQPFGTAYDIGSSSIAVIENDNETIALVALDLTVTSYDPDAIANLFAQAVDVSDIQIVYIHWGAEYTKGHSDTQERVARTLITEGADLIIGHHPHVVQDIALHEGVPVFYSLGNFIFDQYFSRDVQEGLALSVDVHERVVELIPVTSIDSRISPRVMHAKEKNAFLADLAKRSEGALSAEIQDGRITF